MKPSFLEFCKSMSEHSAFDKETGKKVYKYELYHYHGLTCINDVRLKFNVEYTPIDIYA